MGKPPGSVSLFPRAVAHAYRIRPDVLRMTSKALQDVICACLLPAKPRSRVYTACRCGTLKTQEWKTRDQISQRWLKAGPPSMEREMDKYKCTMYR